MCWGKWQQSQSHTLFLKKNLNEFEKKMKKGKGKTNLITRNKLSHTVVNET